MRILRRLLLRCPRLAPLALAATLAGPALPPADAASPDAKLEIRHGDHIASSATRWPTGCSTTAGWRRYLHSRFPEHDLVIRNLGFSGDELTIRLRSADFGTPRRVADRAPRPTSSSPSSATTSRSPARRGCAKFKKDLDDFIKHTLAQKYNGKSRAAAGALLADRPRGPARPQPARRQRRTTSGSSSTPQAMAEVAKAERRPVRRSVPRRRATLYAEAAQAADDQRHPPDDRAATGSWPQIIDQALVRRRAEPQARRRRRSRSSARPSSTRTSTGSTATARWTATRSTAAGPT